MGNENEQTPNSQAGAQGTSTPVAPVPSTAESKLAEAKTFQEHRAIRERGGVRNRIDQKTREAGEATRAAREAAEAAKAVVEELRKGNGHAQPAPAAAAQPAPAAQAAQPAPEPAKFDKPRPKIGDFKDVDEYWSAMADWQIEKRQADKAPGPEAQKPAAVPDTPEVAALKVELTKTFEGFKVRATEFRDKHPDFVDRLNGAAGRGLTLSPQNERILMELDNGPAVAYYLADPANEAKAREIMAMGPVRGNIELIKLSERMTVNPASYVSSAPAPIPQLRGSNSRTELPLDSKELSFQDYKRLRKASKLHN